MAFCRPHFPWLLPPIGLFFFFCALLLATPGCQHAPPRILPAAWQCATAPTQGGLAVAVTTMAPRRSLRLNLDWIRPNSAADTVRLQLSDGIGRLVADLTLQQTPPAVISHLKPTPPWVAGLTIDAAGSLVWHGKPLPLAVSDIPCLLAGCLPRNWHPATGRFPATVAGTPMQVRVSGRHWLSWMQPPILTWQPQHPRGAFSLTVADRLQLEARPVTGESGP